jgi:hypothetical protein
MKRFLSIIALCIVAAVAYGILHDQVTARICVEYFTIGHPPIFATDDPTLLGLGWGVIATWWFGLLLGLPLAVMARVGRLPKRDVRSLVRPIVGLMLFSAASALFAGIVGWLLARNGVVVLVGPMASAVPADRHVAFLTCLWAHSASYLVGFVGGIVLIVRISMWRFRAGREGSARTIRN